MTHQLRTFIGVPIVLPPKLRTILQQFGEMGRAVRAVDAGNTHITVKFLGDTPAELLTEIGNIIDTVAASVKAFELELMGIGAFPHWNRPMVTWAGVRPEEPLTTIAEQLESELEPLGFPREKREYHPHLTLARIKAKPPALLHEIAQTNESESFGTQTIDRVILYQSDYQSESQSSGPVYTPIKTAILSANPD